MVWGQDATVWDTEMDEVNLAAHHYQDIPDNKLIITTWHDTDTPTAVFQFAKHHARHPHATLDSTNIVHIAASAKPELLQQFQNT